MKHKYAIFVRFINVLFDIFSLNIAILFNIIDNFYYLNLLLSILWINFAWIISTFFAKLYLFKNLIYFREGLISSIKAFIIFIALNTTLYFFLGSFFITRMIFIKILLFYLIIFILSRFFFYTLKKYYSLEFFWSKNVLTVGDLDISELLKKQFSSKMELGYKHILHFTDEEVKNQDPQILIEILSKNSIEEVFFVNSKINHDLLYTYIKVLDQYSLRVKFVPDFSNFFTKPNNLVLIGDYPVLFLRNEPLESLYNRMLKRLFDIFFSLLVLILIFSWLFPLIALLIKLESRGPVFFKQLRTGRKNAPFWCYKFRSMRLNDFSDSKVATKGDSRITFFGAIMRKTSIDELPQFFNVLFGNMSIVGPRPHMLIHTNQYGEIIDQYMVRHFVKPGITGWAQVNGFRGEIQSVRDIEGRIEKDIWYIENWSLALDLHIVLLTVYNILRGEEKAY